MKLFIGLNVFFALLFFACFVIASEVPADIQENSSEQYLFNVSKEAFREENYQKALGLFNHFLEKYPHSRLTPDVVKYWTDCRVRLMYFDKGVKRRVGITEVKMDTNALATIKTAGRRTVKEKENPKTTPSNSPDNLLTINFNEYAAHVLRSNPSYLFEREEYNKSYVNFASRLLAYGFNVSLIPNATVYHDNGVQYGTDLRVEIAKTLYDGGKKQILERELELVKALSAENLLNSTNNAILAAANYFTALYYSQEECFLLKRKFREYADFMRQIENGYQKGLKVSAYDYYSAKSQYLFLERDLLNKKSEVLKAETAFRQFGHIDSDRQIKLTPLSFDTSATRENMEKNAVTSNSLIRAARIKNNLQIMSIKEKMAEDGITVKADSSLGVRLGTSNYAGDNAARGSGSQAIATIGITATIPLFDGGVRKSNVLAEEIEGIKQKLNVMKTTDEIIGKVNDIYTDYQTLEKNLEISVQLLELNQKRLRIAVERSEKGLEEFRSVREAWNDSISSEMDTIRQATILQKLRLDLAILSGKRPADLCPED